MICVYAEQCNSEICLQKKSHVHDQFCSGGSCSWGEDTHCVPESKREIVFDILSAHLTREGTEEVTAQIMAVFGEAA